MSHVPPVYLDHAATTPMHPAAIEAMTAALAIVGNASSLHTAGRAARRRMESRGRASPRPAGARPSEVVFTAGGTESDNLAVKGHLLARRDADENRRRIITTAVEHHAVLDAVGWLVDHEQAEVTFAAHRAGRFGDARRAGRRWRTTAPDVALVSVMWANNEVGTIMPIAELAAIAAEFEVPMHSDAVQTVGQVPVGFAASGLSAMSVTAHKFGGPAGWGAAAAPRHRLRAAAARRRAGARRRSGTPDVAGGRDGRGGRYRGRDPGDHRRAAAPCGSGWIDGVLGSVDDAHLNGARGEHRLPGNAHFTFRGCEGDSLLMLLDANGIECSTGSACTAGGAAVARAAGDGADAATARGSLRLSLGTPAPRPTSTPRCGCCPRRWSPGAPGRAGQRVGGGLR